MVKGKHALQSAVRRSEAAHEHIDRLTDQLVEAKTRARQYEAAARRVPAMEAEQRRLRLELEQGTSPRVRELERKVDSQRAQLAELQINLKIAQEGNDKIIEHLFALFPGTWLEYEEYIFAGLPDRDGRTNTVRIIPNNCEGPNPIALQRARGERSSKGEALLSGLKDSPRGGDEAP